jgi:hypothetical protein
LEQVPAADTAKPARARRGEGQFSEVIENKDVLTADPGKVKSLKTNNKTDDHSVGVPEKSGKGRWQHKRRLTPTERIPWTLFTYRRAGEAERAAIDNWMLMLVGYTVPALLLMANQIVAGKDPVDAEATWSEDRPTHQAYMRILCARIEARDKATSVNSRSLFGKLFRDRSPGGRADCQDRSY